MYSNRHLMAYSTAFENSSTPFRFYQTNIVLEPDRAFFPYTNWFRGEYTSCFPIIAEREAGFYPRTPPQNTRCDDHTEEEKKPNHCYRGATQQMQRCYTDFVGGTKGVTKRSKNNMYNTKWIQTDPSYLENEPVLSYI